MYTKLFQTMEVFCSRLGSSTDQWVLHIIIHVVIHFLQCSKCIGDFGAAVENLLVKHGKKIVGTYKNTDTVCKTCVHL